jgi:hypothetical protein
MAKADDKLIEEAKKRFQRCEEHEAKTRPLWIEDRRFANGDSDNGWQWDEAIRKAREAKKLPCLTINKTKQHIRQITNDGRQNKPSVRISPVDSGADKKTADVLNGIVRHIESNSSADVAYDTALEHAVEGGIGYWRVTTDYASDDSFEQEIFIRRIKNPLNVYLDPEIQEADGSDAKFGFFFRDMLKEEFEAEFPNAEAIGWPLEGGSSWLNKDQIRVAEYFKVVEERDTLIADPQGNTLLLSEMEPDMAAAVKEQVKAKALRARSVSKRSVKWFLIAGDQILDSKDWPGKYIPIVRVVGEEVEIDGEIDRKGHTRGIKDPQRMYNYWTSSATANVALQGNQPYLAPAEAIEGYEEYWNNLNTGDFPYLPFNAWNEEGQQIPMPQRQQPPVMAQAFMQGMQVASEEMKMASGQYDASMGAKSNETSGRAITARQREGDTATFHFIDNVARAIKYTGKILIDLIPKIYDTPRVARILGEDGSEKMVKIDPQQQQAYAKQQNQQTREIEEIYNPSVGRYDVTVDVGPSYTTRRQEAFYALTDMASRNPQVMAVAGDLVMKAADFPMASELAERFEKTLPPNLQTDGDEQDPKLMQMQQMIQQLQGQLQALGAEKKAENDKLLIDRYAKETDRLKLLLPMLGPDVAAQLAAEFGLQVIASPDIYPGGQPPDPQRFAQPQPAPAGFFTPEGSEQ